MSFYAEMRGRKQDQAVKCELSHDRVRLIFLSSYDKKGNATPPSQTRWRRRAGRHGDRSVGFTQTAIRLS